MIDLSGQKIVQIDDDRNFLKITKRMIALKSRGASLIQIQHTTQSLDELANKVLENTPTILVVDYDLCEGIKGVHIIAKIRQSIPQTNIIGWSGYLDQSTKESFEESGANHTTKKGVDIVAIIQQALSKK